MFALDSSHVKTHLAQNQLLKLMLKKFLSIVKTILMHSFIEKQNST